MLVLAWETTSAQGSVALMEDDVVRYEQALPPRAYSTELLPALEAALHESHVGLAEVDLFASTDGPGSFTGVRIGLTALKALMEALGRPAVAVSTLRTVAAGSGTAPAAALLDASRGEVYLGIYPQGASGPDECELLVSLEEAGRQLRDAGYPQAFTPDAALAERCAALWAEVGAATPGPAPTHLAAALGRLAQRRFAAGGAGEALRLDARYIRRSDAEIFAPRTPR